MKTSHILLSVALIAVAGFGIGPLRQMVQEKETQNERLFIQKQQQIQRLAELENTETVTGSRGAIPTRPEQLAFVEDLNRIAKKTGFILPKSWSFAIGRNSTVNADQLGVSFSLSGRREQILNFLKEVEANPRFMGVTGFSFSTDASRSIPTTTMGISLYAFFIEA